MGACGAGHFEQEVGEENEADKHDGIFQRALDALIGIAFLHEPDSHVATVPFGQFAKVEIGPCAGNAAGQIGHAPMRLEAFRLAVACRMALGQYAALEAGIIPIAHKVDPRILCKWRDG